MPLTDSKITTRFLPVKLTPEEMEDFRKRLLDSMDEGDQIEAEKKASADAFKHRLPENAANTDYWRRCLKEKAEHRQVEVRTDPDLRANKIRTIRTDTWEEVDFRAMTPNEREELEQQRIPFDGIDTVEFSFQGRTATLGKPEAEAQEAAEDAPVDSDDRPWTSLSESRPR